MLRLLNNRILPKICHPSLFWRIGNVRTGFETYDTRLLDALCDVYTEENDVRQKRLTRSMVVKLPVNEQVKNIFK